MARDEQDPRAPFGADTRVDMPGRPAAPPQVNRGSLTSRATAAAAAIAAATAAVDTSLASLMSNRPTRSPDTSHPGTLVAFHFPLWEGQFFLGSYFVQSVVLCRIVPGKILL